MPIVVASNGTDPSVNVGIRPDSITASPAQLSILFQIGISKLTERNSNGDIVRSISLHNQAQNFTSVNSSSFFNYTTSNAIWVYTLELSNGATVEATVSIFIIFKIMYFYLYYIF